MRDFDLAMRGWQEEWRELPGNVSTQGWGRQNGERYRHALPRDVWEEGLWPEIRGPLREYLRQGRVQPHTGVHNLCSSWVACANFYFPFRNDDGTCLLTGFLREAVDHRIEQVTKVELEYESPIPELKPAQLLGETGGSRGAGQTSPDLALEVATKIEGRSQQGVVLVENKLTEHSFYRCSARTRKEKDGRPPNPDPGRCLDALNVATKTDLVCHQVSPRWERRYWEHLTPDEERFSRLCGCPAATAGYQLFRQQALAEGYLRGGVPFVVSCVAYDERNDAITSCLRSTGVEDIEDFPKLFKQARAPLKAFTHQRWYSYVLKHGGETWKPWTRWMAQRYGVGDCAAAFDQVAATRKPSPLGGGRASVHPEK